MILQQLSDSKDYKYYSFEEYLALEEKSTYKNEYEKGRIKAMSGGTLDHNTISQNIGTAIAVALRQKTKNVG